MPGDMIFKLPVLVLYMAFRQVLNLLNRANIKKYLLLVEIKCLPSSIIKTVLPVSFLVTAVAPYCLNQMKKAMV